MTTETSANPRYGINSYLEWVEREGIKVAHGLSLDLFEVETAHWPRLGAKASAAHFNGSGDYCNMFVIDIPAGGSTLPQQHLYEESYYILEGRGSTQLEGSPREIRADDLPLGGRKEERHLPGPAPDLDDPRVARDGAVQELGELAPTRSRA